MGLEIAVEEHCTVEVAKAMVKTEIPRDRQNKICVCWLRTQNNLIKFSWNYDLLHLSKKNVDPSLAAKQSVPLLFLNLSEKERAQSRIALNSVQYWSKETGL